MLAKIIKRSFSSDKSLANQLRKYTWHQKQIFEKRKSIINDIKQELKSLSFLSAKQEPLDKGSFYESMFTNPLFKSVNRNSAHKMHEDPEIEVTLFQNIKKTMEENKDNSEAIQKVFILTRNHLFMTPQIKDYLSKQLNQMLKDGDFQLFSMCIKGNKKFLKQFLPELQKGQHLNVKEMFSSNDAMDIDLEDDEPKLMKDGVDFKFNESSLNYTSSVEERQKDSSYSRFLENQWDDERVNYHESNIIKGLQANDSKVVNLQDLDNPEITYQIYNDDFLMMAEIEFSKSANSNFDFLVRKMEDEQSLYALYLIFRSYEDSGIGEAKDDVMIGNFIQRVSNIQPEQFLGNLIKTQLQNQSLEVDNLLYIVAQFRIFDIRFGIRFLKQVLIHKGNHLHIDELLLMIKVSTQILFSMMYEQDYILEKELEKLLTTYIFNNLNLDLINLMPCFFDFIKLCNAIKSIQTNPKQQQTLVEMSLQLYGGCFQAPEAQTDENGELEIQAFKDIESVEKFARCVQVISKGQQQELSPETKVLFKTFIENILVQQVYKQSQIVLYQIMDILVNTSLLYDMQKFSLLNSYVMTYFKTLLEGGIDASQTSTSMNNTDEGSEIKNKEIDLEITDDEFSVAHNINFSLHYQICCYIRFASKYKFIKQIDLNFFESMVSALPRNDLRPFGYIYESILSNHSHWMQDDNNKLNTFIQLQDMCFILLKQTPLHLNFPINLCVTLRNYLTYNNLYLKQVKFQIVDLADYKILTPMKKSSSKQNNDGQKEDTESEVEQESKISMNGHPKILNFPFPTELIRRLSPVNKNLKLFLQQHLTEENSEDNIQKKRKYLFEQIEYQIVNNSPNPNELFEIVRTNAGLRKMIQQNQNQFSIIKKYTLFLLQLNYTQFLQFKKLKESKRKESEEQIRSGNKLTNEQTSAQSLATTTLNPSGGVSQGDSVFSETLFFVRLCQEEHQRCFDSQLVCEFISNNIHQMDFNGLLFSKQYLNTASIKDPSLHSKIQQRLMYVINPEHINLKNSLNLLKAFSLDDFDEKTLFLLENEIVNKFNLVNITNLTVLFKKYYFKARINPIRLISGVSQNAYRYLSQINDQSYWMFLFLNKFKPSSLQALNLETMQFDMQNLTKEFFVKLIMLFVEQDLVTTVNLREGLAIDESGFNKTYYEQVAKENSQTLQLISHKREILQEKISFYLNKLPQIESNMRFQKELKQIINNKTFQPSAQIENTYQYLTLFYYFKVGEQQEHSLTISPEVIEKTIQNLFAQYQNIKSINVNQLVAGIYLLNEMNKSSKNFILSLKEWNNLLHFVETDNRSAPLSDTPCLNNLMRLYYLGLSYQMKESKELPQEDMKKITQQVQDAFLYYKMKRNETKDTLLSWANLIALNKKQTEQQKGKVAAPLIACFGGQEVKVLDKLESILTKRIDFLDISSLFEVYNVYFANDLASFQSIEMFEKLLKDIDNRTQQQQQRVSNRQQLNNTNQRVAIPSRASIEGGQSFNKWNNQKQHQ